MAAEISFDEQRNALYLSRRFTPAGAAAYPSILRGAVATGGDADLAAKLRMHGCFAPTETREKAGKVTVAKVPTTAPDTFAEGEFNRFYLRAICLAAIADGIDHVVVYRARHSENPRRESEAMIGTKLDPHKLLEDLRNNVGWDTYLGLPPGPNSGLSAKLPITK
jgi:hypothetical protein